MEVFEVMVVRLYEQFFVNYLSQLHQGLAELTSNFETEIAADTDQRRPIFDVEAESSSPDPSSSGPLSTDPSLPGPSSSGPSFPGPSFPDPSYLLRNEVINKSENNADEAILCDRDSKALSIQSSGVSGGNKELYVIMAIKLPRGPERTKYTPSMVYENVKARLQYFEDNGDFKKFDAYSTKMVEIYSKSEVWDIVAAVKVEQARSEVYRNAFRSARHLAKGALELAGRTRSPSLFTAQAFLILSTVARNKSKLGKAQRYLEQAEQCFQSSYSIEDLARFHEVYGSFLDAMMGITAKRVGKIQNKAIIHFRKMYEVGSQDAEQRVCDKKRFYSLLRMARIRLDSNHQIGRTKRTVSKDAINRTEEILGILERDFLKTIPRGSKIQFQLVKSDLYYRKGEYNDSLELLRKCQKRAKKFGYETEDPKILQVQ